jgi:hypothetical protein
MATLTPRAVQQRMHRGRVELVAVRQPEPDFEIYWTDSHVEPDIIEPVMIGPTSHERYDWTDFTRES